MEITYFQVCCWIVAQIVLQFDERDCPTQFSGFQRIVANRSTRQQVLAGVLVACPARLIVCSESRTSPVALVHREQPRGARALRRTGGHIARCFHIAEVEIHLHSRITQPWIVRIERDGMLNDLDGFRQLAVKHPTECSIALQRRNEVRIEFQRLQCLLLGGLDAAFLESEHGIHETRTG